MSTRCRRCHREDREERRRAMKEAHGIPNAVKLKMQHDGEAQVTVRDGQQLVHLLVENATWGAGLTPDQARWIARRLIESSQRVEKSNRKSTWVEGEPEKKP